MNRIFVVPAEGLQIPFPDNPRRYLKPKGERVKNDIYWRNRIRSREVSMQKEPVTPTVIKKETKPSK